MRAHARNGTHGDERAGVVVLLADERGDGTFLIKVARSVDRTAAQLLVDYQAQNPFYELALVVETDFTKTAHDLIVDRLRTVVQPRANRFFTTDALTTATDAGKAVAAEIRANEAIAALVA